MRRLYVDPMSTNSEELVPPPVDGSWDPEAAARQVAGSDSGEANQRLALLYRAASGLLETERPREYVRNLFEALSAELRLDAYFNFLLESFEGRERLHLDSYAGISKEEAGSCEWLEMGEAVSGAVAVERQPRVVTGVAGSTDPLTTLIRTFGIRAYASFPLEVRGRLVGTLSFGVRDRDEYTKEEIALLQAVAHHVAIAIDRSNAWEAEKQARKTAERTSAAKSRFLSTLSHEVRTPLAAVVSLTELIESQRPGPVTAEQGKHLARIRSSAWDVVAMIDEILNYSRVDAGQERVSVEPAELTSVVRGVVEMLTPEAQTAGLELRLRNGDVPFHMVTDIGKVRQITTNLIGNAIRYTETGSVEVEIESGPGEELRVRVTDTGPGIPPERVEDIFEAFVRLDGGGGPASGTGLGLAVSRRLARLLGGDIEVESVPGKGSTFALRLPQLVDEATQTLIRD